MTPGFIEPCLPMMSRTVPAGTGWAYEIQTRRIPLHLQTRRRPCAGVLTGGHDWSAQLPAIVEAMRAFPVTSVTLDGEVVICGADGVSQFDRTSTVFGRRGSREAFLHAFDLLEFDGQDLRGKTMGCSPSIAGAATHQSRRRHPPVRAYRGHGRRRRVPRRVQHGAGGHRRQRRDSRYRSGRCRDWVKIKNIAHPAIERAMLIALSKRRRLG